MATALLVLVVVLVIAALVFGVVTLLSGDDPGLSTVETDGRALPLPNNRSLTEVDLKTVRFDVELRGYRMAQVDRVLRRTAYDVGYKDEMIAVLEAEVIALREGRVEDAELLRKARESAANPATGSPASGSGLHRAAGPSEDDELLLDDLSEDGDDDLPVLADQDASDDDTSDGVVNDGEATGGDQSGADGDRKDGDRHDTEDDDRQNKRDDDVEHHETEERLDEDPTRETTNAADVSEGRAARG